TEDERKNRIPLDHTKKAIVISLNFFRPTVAVIFNMTGPATANTAANTVMSCPADPTETPKSAAICGKIPPTTSSTKPTVTAARARKYIFGFIVNTFFHNGCYYRVFTTRYSRLWNRWREPAVLRFTFSLFIEPLDHDRCSSFRFLSVYRTDRPCQKFFFSHFLRL